MASAVYRFLVVSNYFVFVVIFISKNRAFDHYHGDILKDIVIKYMTLYLHMLEIIYAFTAWMFIILIMLQRSTFVFGGTGMYVDIHIKYCTY